MGVVKTNNLQTFISYNSAKWESVQY